MGNALASMTEFEQTFGDRQTLGFNMELDDPFQPFNEGPSQTDLVPGFGEQRTSGQKTGWLSSYSHMLNAIDEGGVFDWSDMMTPSNRNSLGLALSAAGLGDGSYRSGLIGDGLRALNDLGKVGDKNLFEVDSDSPLLPGLDGIIPGDHLKSSDNFRISDINSLETGDTNSLLKENSTDSYVDNTTGASIVRENIDPNVLPSSEGPGDLLGHWGAEKLTQLTESNFSSTGLKLEAFNTSFDIEENVTDSAKVNDTAPLNTSLEISGGRAVFGENASSLVPADSVDKNVVQDKSSYNLRNKAGSTTREIGAVFSDKFTLPPDIALGSNRVRRQASDSSSRSGSPPPWAMGPQMAIPSNPGARGRLTTRPSSPAFPLPNMRQGGPPPPGMNGNSFGGNPMMGGPQFPGQNGQPFGGPMGQQFPPGMMPPQQFPGGTQSSRRPNVQPFGGLQRQMGSQGQAAENPLGIPIPIKNPSGQPRQNPFGRGSPNQFGQRGENQFGQRRPNPFGQGGPNSFGQGGPNSFGQGGPNSFGQGGPNSFGQGGSSSFGQRGPNPFNQGGPNPFGQGGPNPFGQGGQNSFGRPNQNPFGQPRSNQNTFGQPSQSPFQRPNQNPFGQQAQNPFGRQNQSPFGQQPRPPFGPQNRDPFGSSGSFPVPPGPGRLPGDEEADISPVSPLESPPPPDGFDPELELKPSPFESLGSFPLGPPSTSGGQNPFGSPQGLPRDSNSMSFGRPNQMMGNGPFQQQQQNPFASFPRSNNGFGGQMPGMPPNFNQMGGFPGMPSQFGQNNFGSRPGMPFMGGDQFGSGNGRNPFSSRGGSGPPSMPGFPGMNNPFMSSSPFGRSSSYPPMRNQFNSQMRNPLSSRSMSPFSSPFSSSMRGGGFPGMMDMRGMPGGRAMRPPMGMFPTRPMGSRSSRSRN
ncbi:S-antigen protein [Elysia marginata]|uniref:S-antigen protein n=1 Tax=Elysia marginata TaxID=1093978 RepID=A0AAV4JN54_9GAST|nr:S-antigen protein [Elysia marginata]